MLLLKIIGGTGVTRPHLYSFWKDELWKKISKLEYQTTEKTKVFSEEDDFELFLIPAACGNNKVLIEILLENKFYLPAEITNLVTSAVIEIFEEKDYTIFIPGKSEIIVKKK